MTTQESWEAALSARLRGKEVPSAGVPDERATPRSAGEAADPRRATLPMPGPAGGSRPGAAPRLTTRQVGSDAALAAEYARLSRRAGTPAWRRAARRVASLWRADDAPTVLARCGTVIQRPVATGRRVVILGACGGAGTSTIALALAEILAAVRGEATVVLGAPGDGGGVLARVAPEAVLTCPELWSPAGPGAPDALPDALPNVPVTVFVPPGPGASTRLALQRLARQRSYAIADLGPGGQAQARAHDEGAGLGEAHAVVVVVAPRITAVAAARGLLRWLTALGAGACTRLVVCDTGSPTGLSAAAAAAALADLGCPIDVIPPDRHLAAGAQLDLALLAELPGDPQAPHIDVPPGGLHEGDLAVLGVEDAAAADLDAGVRQLARVLDAELFGELDQVGLAERLPGLRHQVGVLALDVHL